MIDEICYYYGYYRPKTYRENARRDYLNFANCKKCTAKKIRSKRLVSGYPPFFIPKP